MIEAVLADPVLLAHLGFILFVMLGALLVVKWPKLVWLHLPAVAWAVFVEVANEPCPLTPLENRLRELAGERGYEETFVEHYLLPWIYPESLTRRVQLALAAAALAVNLVTYAVAYRFRRGSAEPSPSRHR